MHPPSTRSAGRLRALGILALVAGLTWLPNSAGLAQSAAPVPLPSYFATVGAGVHGNLAFRTQFELSNPSAEARGGELWLFGSRGEGLDAAFAHSWVGEPGQWAVEANRISFTILPETSLIATLLPRPDGELGWGRLESSGPLQVRATLQVARVPPLSRPDRLDFEDHLEQIAEMEPVTGLKSLSFSLWLHAGLTATSTAFSLVNLSGAPGDVALTLTSGGNEITRTVQLDPGQMLVNYFDRFWELAFPAIFPFELRATARVEAQVPLAVAVLRTLNGLPASGVAVAALPLAPRELPAEPGREFQLGVGERGVIGDGEVKVDFWNVVSDSRCPLDVVCVTAGEAVIEVDVLVAGAELQRVRLSDISGQDSALAGGYRIRLVEVDPDPVSTRTLDISEYRATLRVSREGG